MNTAMNNAISALKTHQIKMDVTAHNVANVNTNGFKSSSVTFKDAHPQTIQEAGAAGNGRGGINPMQVGNGVAASSIGKNEAPGAMMSENGDIFEMSNTNLTKELTDMITTQRGFEANVKTIKTADEMLEELTKLKK